MKRTGLFLMCLLLSGIALTAGTAGNAFAARYTPPPAQTAILVCQVAGTGITVSDFSNTTTAAITAGEDCATALSALEQGSLQIRSVQPVATSPISIIYTLTGNAWETAPTNPPTPAPED